MSAEGNYPKVADGAYSSQLDNWSESIMLMESVATNKEQMESIFTNPRYSYGENDPVKNLYAFLHDEDPEPTSFYVRYWMGFRVILRLVLGFLDFYQFKRYVAVLFYALFVLVICSIAKHVDTKTSFLFALSIILVKPYVISNSIQFSCCFFIAFISMLMIPWIYRNPKYEGLFFMEIGMITMYFDFYTTPIITFGFPMVYLYVLRAINGDNTKIKRILTNFTIWISAYGLMWISRLLLTTIFTSVNGFENGFSSMAGRLGLKTTEGLEEYYSVKLALYKVARAVFSDKEGFIIIFALIIILTVVFFIEFKRGKITGANLVAHKNLVFISLFPITWFIIAAQPTAIHAWFQYRGIALLYWALGGYISLAYGYPQKLNENKKEKIHLST